MKKDIIEEMNSFFTNRVFIFDGSIEFLPDGGARIEPSKDQSAGMTCPYCKNANVKIIPVAGIDGIIEGGGNTWSMHDCWCLACRGFYSMLINELSERIIVCDRFHPISAGKD